MPLISFGFLFPRYYTQYGINMENKRSRQKRNILYLIDLFLENNGYKETAECLKFEAKLTDEYVVCDNINLETILVEFETYYYQRFKNYPHLCKQIHSYNERVQNKKRISNKTNKEKINQQNNFQLKNNSTKNTVENMTDFVIYNSLFSKPQMVDENNANSTLSNEEWIRNGDWKEYTNVILQNMSSQRVNVRWDDVKGLEDEKEFLKEAIIYPIKYPHLFTDTIEPWKSILMYGPPGTGKTLLAKAVATESSATFFNISSSSIINKWRGDTEKLIKALFEVALQHAPSIIFIDEIDAMTLKRNLYEHEASRRMKSELFLGIDALTQAKGNVFLLATTNTPWDLDEAVLRRFEKHVHIKTPNKRARKLLLCHFLPKTIHINPLIEAEIDYEFIADITARYSGCDIKNLCKEVKMNFIRKILSDLESNHLPRNTCHSDKKIINEDVENVLTKFKPIVSHLEDKYIQWEAEYNYKGNENRVNI